MTVRNLDALFEPKVIAFVGASNQPNSGNGELDVRDHRPVIKASLHLEPASGSIEVVAADRQARESFCSAHRVLVLSRSSTLAAPVCQPSALDAGRTSHALPVRKLAGGDFTYIELEIVDVTYDSGQN